MSSLKIGLLLNGGEQEDLACSRVYSLGYQGLGPQALCKGEVQVACETLARPVTTGLHHECSTTTSVKKGGSSASK